MTEPYCQHPGCHDARTMAYSNTPVTAGAQHAPMGAQPSLFIAAGDLPAGRRWCYIHAGMHERVALRGPWWS